MRVPSLPILNQVEPINSVDEPRLLRRFSTFLFMFMVATLVIPVFEVPFVGLSISAPILYPLALEVFLGKRIKLGNYSYWLVLTYLLAFGAVASLAFNQFLYSSPEITADDFIELIRYTYWILSFIMTIIIVSSDEWIYRRIVIFMGVSALGLGWLRVLEGVVFQTLGARYGYFLSQNSYGLLFSTFTPFALGLIFIVGRRWYPYIAVSIVIQIIAVMANVSRGSWISLALAVLMYVFLYGFVSRRRVIESILATFVAAAIIALFVTIMPASLLSSIQGRLNTFTHLDEDKSYQIRVLLVQKGFQIFEESPLVGAGIGRFDTTEIGLVLPRVLRYGSQEHFNRKSSHNSYMQMLAETGLLGFIPYGIIVLTTWVLGFFAAVRMGREGKYEGLIIFTGLVTMSTHLWAISALTTTSTWFMYGLMGAIIQRYWFRKNAYTDNLED